MVDTEKSYPAHNHGLVSGVNPVDGGLFRGPRPFLGFRNVSDPISGPSTRINSQRRKPGRGGKYEKNSWPSGRQEILDFQPCAGVRNVE